LVSKDTKIYKFKAIFFEEGKTQRKHYQVESGKKVSAWVLCLQMISTALSIPLNYMSTDSLKRMFFGSFSYLHPSF
jgi:hypothetical protein